MAVAPATALDDAYALLNPRPLEFLPTGGPPDPATDPSLYTEPPPLESSERRRPGAMDRIRTRLMGQADHTKVFLSGHVGSGKSTQINRLAAEPGIRQAFTVVQLRFEEQEWAFLDAAQVLFRMAGALFELGDKEKLLSHSGRWQKILRTLDEKLAGAAGIQAKDGATSVEINAFFLKLRTDLKLSEARRKQFRALGESQQTLLQDLIAELCDDIEDNLVKAGRSGSLLMLLDDLDKVRGQEQQRDIFETNLSALFVPPLRALYTTPTGVSFGATRAAMRQCLEHLYPVRTLRKAPETYDATQAYTAERFGFFQELLRHRVAPGVFDEESVRLAAIFSGGVLRDFFHLLREGILIARYNGLEVVDAVTMRETIRDARFRESAGLYAPDWEVLLRVHRTHEISEEHRRYLDQSRILECYNDEVWFEVNPLLWGLLERRARDAVAG